MRLTIKKTLVPQVAVGVHFARTMKAIRFSLHAEANLVAREISRADAEAAIRQPDRREPGRPPREIVNRVYSDTRGGPLKLDHG